MLARKSVLIVLNNAVGAALGLVAAYFMGHYLGRDAMGMWAFGLALVSLVAFLGDMGLNVAHQKRVAEHGAPLATLVGTFARLRTMTTLGMVGLVGLGLVVWLVVLGKGITDATTLPVLLLALGYVALMLWLALPKSTFVGLGRIAAGELPVLVEHLVRVPAIALVALWFAVGAGKRGPLASRVAPLFERLPELSAAPSTAGLLLAAAHVAGMLAAVGVAYLLFARLRVPRGAPSKAVSRDYLTMALPIALHMGVGTLATQVDRVMLGYFWNAAEAGGYFASQRIVLLVLALPTAVITTLFPQVSYHLSRNERAETKAMLLTAERYLSMVLFLVLALVFAFAEQGLNLVFGSGFRDQATTLRVLALFVLFGSLARPYQALVTGAGRSVVLLKAGVVAAVLNLGLNAVLIPDSLLGVPLAGLRSLGAAIATAVAMLAAFVVFRIESQRVLPTPPLPSFFAKHLVASLVAAGVAVVPAWMGASEAYRLLGDFYPLPGLLAGGAMVTAVYVLVLWLLRDLTRRDVAFVRGALHPVAVLRDAARDLSGNAKPRS